ncbi:MAG: hypothetical protein WC223_13020 [Bacteroidales bacterium]|jgi:hypothetical protein
MNETERIEKIKEVGFQLRGSGYKDEVEYNKGNYTYQFWVLPERDVELETTPFYFNEKNDFIHFTSMESLNSILSSGNIRMYSLNNMDDQYEMSYAIEKYCFKKEFFEENDEKQHVYCFSMCPSELLKDETEEHTLWNIIGRKGNGAIIRFEFLNRNRWYNYHLSKIYYQENEWLENIKSLNCSTTKEILDLKITGFLKNEIYSFEKEIRLLFDCRPKFSTIITRNDKQIYPIVHLDKFINKEKVSYFEMPLPQFIEDSSDFEIFDALRQKYEIPKIKINEIILGYRFSETDVLNLKQKLNFEKLGIKIYLSKLKKWY